MNNTLHALHNLIISAIAPANDMQKSILLQALTMMGELTNDNQHIIEDYRDMLQESRIEEEVEQALLHHFKG